MESGYQQSLIQTEQQKQTFSACTRCARPQERFLSTYRTSDLGTTRLVMLDPQQFIDKARSSLESQGTQPIDGLVQYVDDDDYVGDVGPFRKLRAFAYQSEWRLVC